MSNTDYYKDRHGSIRRVTPKSSKKVRAKAKRVISDKLLETLKDTKAARRAWHVKMEDPNG